jgi:hypothetical protein
MAVTGNKTAWWFSRSHEHLLLLAEVPQRKIAERFSEEGSRRFSKESFSKQAQAPDIV